MVKTLFVLLLMVGITFAASPGSSETLEIVQGQKKTADRGRLTIKFVDILEDSRCPPNVQCVWAGNAKVRLAVSRGKASPKFIELNTGVYPQSMKLYGYEIKLTGLTERVPDHMMLHDKEPVVTIVVTK